MQIVRYADGGLRSAMISYDRRRYSIPVTIVSRAKWGRIYSPGAVSESKSAGRTRAIIEK
jgi:hypothetical protein